MSMKTKDIVWILFIVIFAISVLQTDGATRSYRRSRYRSTSSSSGGGSSWIPGVVIGVILVVFIIVIAIRCYWSKKTGNPFCGGQKRRVGSVKDIRDESTVVAPPSQPYGQVMQPPPAYSDGQVMPPPPAYSDPVYPPPSDPVYPPQKY